MTKEFKNFFRTVGENEGSKCHYPTRLNVIVQRNKNNE